MKYTESHEWIEIAHDVATVGVTDHAQKELGDIVYTELPKVGSEVKKGQEVVVLESTKAAADVYAPLSGKIISVNTALGSNPECVNTSPENEGWLFKMTFNDPKEVEALMDRDAYLGMLT